MSEHGAAIFTFPERQRDGETWEPWLSSEAVGRHFGVAERTVRRWRNEGMPSRMFGGSRRFRLSECERWHEGRAG